MLQSLLAIAAGASLGAIARWLLSISLNGLFPALPPGTLLANLIGAYLIGMALAWFSQHPDLPPEWRLFVVTGFLGGLTTFSTFSGEVTHHLAAGRLGWALALVGGHVLGSLAMTGLGMATVAGLRRFA